MENNLDTASNDQETEILGTRENIYKIGDLAREFDVTLRTLRFYEDRGLVKPSRMGTTRLYSAEDRERLRIALFCKRIGLSLGEIRTILELHETSEDNDNAESQIKNVYLSQLAALEKQQEETRTTIVDLQHKLELMDNGPN